MRGKPVIVVAVQDHGRVVGNPRPAEQLFQRLLVGDIPFHGLFQVALPVPAHGAGDMPLAAGGRVHVDLHQPDLGVLRFSATHWVSTATSGWTYFAMVAPPFACD